MGYHSECEEFIAAMVSEGCPVDVARLILRDAATIQRLSAIECNGTLDEAGNKRFGEAMDRIAARIYELRGGDSPAVGRNWRVQFSGDPRGACVKIKVPSGRVDNRGGWGICVPTRRF